MLFNRAWVSSNIIIAYRALMLARGTTSWDKFYDTKDEIVYKEDGLIEDALPWARAIYNSMIFLSIVLAILCIKWRFLARFFFHIHMIHTCLFYIIPSRVECFTADYVMILQPFLVTIIMACDLKLGLFSIIVSILVGKLFL